MKKETKVEVFLKRNHKYFVFTYYFIFIVLLFSVNLIKVVAANIFPFSFTGFEILSNTIGAILQLNEFPESAFFNILNFSTLLLSITLFIALPLSLKDKFKNKKLRTAFVILTSSLLILTFISYLVLSQEIKGASVEDLENPFAALINVSTQLHILVLYSFLQFPLFLNRFKDNEEVSNNIKRRKTHNNFESEDYELAKEISNNSLDLQIADLQKLKADNKVSEEEFEKKRQKIINTYFNS